MVKLFSAFILGLLLPNLWEYFYIPSNLIFFYFLFLFILASISFILKLNKFFPIYFFIFALLIIGEIKDRDYYASKILENINYKEVVYVEARFIRFIYHADAKHRMLINLDKIIKKDGAVYNNINKKICADLTANQPISFSPYDKISFIGRYDDSVFCDVFKMNTLASNFIFKNIFQIRERLIFAIEQKSYIYGQTGSEMLKALLLGDQTYFGLKLKDIFSNSGTSHIFAISGSHVVLIFAILIFLFKLIRIPIFLSKIFISLFIIFFTLITGFTASVIRASIMIILYFLIEHIGREKSLLHILCLTAFLILIIAPMQIIDIG